MKRHDEKAARLREMPLFASCDDRELHEIAKLVTHCEGVLLPGSPADVDPQKFGAERHPKTAPSDAGRDNVDELLLQDAHNLHKPVLGICYGLQSLNVWRTGTLVQHIESAKVNHEAGRNVERLRRQIDRVAGCGKRHPFQDFGLGLRR